MINDHLSASAPTIPDVHRRSGIGSALPILTSLVLLVAIVTATAALVALAVTVRRAMTEKAA